MTEERGGAVPPPAGEITTAAQASPMSESDVESAAARDLRSFIAGINIA